MSLESLKRLPYVGGMGTATLPKHTRFRADPAKVRVAIRKTSHGWRAYCSSRISGYTISETNASAKFALERVVEAANGLIEGIDLGMQWAYEHPFGAEGVGARR